jgi:hypothetical protein
MARTVTQTARQGGLFNTGAAAVRLAPLSKNQRLDVEPPELTQDAEPLEASFLPDAQLSLQCCHCHKPFPSWARAKRHVKFCRKGPSPRRSLAERIARQNARSILSGKE